MGQKRDEGTGEKERRRGKGEGRKKLNEKCTSKKTKTTFPEKLRQ